MSNKPVVLVINYNENNKPPDETKLNEILLLIKNISPDIFVLTTQDSRSGTDSHIHHRRFYLHQVQLERCYLNDRILVTFHQEHTICRVQYNQVIQHQ